MCILHLTNTSLDWDYRIIKELNTISKNEYASTFAFGIVADNENAIKGDLDVAKVNTKNLKLFTSRFKNRIPKLIYYFLNYIEMNLKFIWLGFKLRPKIVHCHDTFVLFAGYIISIFSGAYLIYDAHELNFMRSSPKFVNKFNKFLESLIWARINLLISVSQGILDYYKFYHGNKETLLVPNCNEYHFLRDGAKGKTNLKNFYNIPSDTNLFIFIGAFIQGRGIENILKSFSDERINSHVVFIGYGEFMPLIVDYQKCGKVHHFGPLKPDDLIDIASSADFGLCLLEPISYSDYLSMPNKFYDYLNSNVKIISSNLPEIQSATLKYDLGYVIDGDIESLKNLIMQIEKQTINHNDQKNLEEFNWNYHSKILLEKYNNILKLSINKLIN